MEISKKSICDMLSDKSYRKRFAIPIYQRPYKWTFEQVERLLDDILSSFNESKEHFTASVVYQRCYEKGEIGYDNYFYLVDGQQRFITIALIIKALMLLDKDNDNEEALKNLLSYKAPDDWRYRICPKNEDRDLFKLIMAANNIDVIINNKSYSGSPLYDNFKGIYANLSKLVDRGISIKDYIENGLSNLTFAEIILDVKEDAQEIFESINSLGLKLRTSDLIRNYLLMGMDDDLYDSVWKPIENKIGEDNMDSFIKDYLFMRNSNTTNINEDKIYREYVSFSKGYIKNGKINREELINDLSICANKYIPLLRDVNDYSNEVRALFNELRILNITTVNPFILRILVEDDLDDKELAKVLNLLVIYLVRRTLAHAGTASLRGFFTGLYNRIFGSVKENKKHYYEAIYSYLNRKGSNDRLRTDSDIERSLPTLNLYSNKSFTTYLLDSIENGRDNGDNRERVIGGVSIEHIMPQTLTPAWEAMLGDDFENIHNTYKNTLGNLSLSSVPKNSIMSNSTFKEKLEILNSPASKYKDLNKMLFNYDSFNKDAILKREKELEEKIFENWPLDPKADDGSIHFEDVYEIDPRVGDRDVYKGDTYPTSFSFKGYGGSVHSLKDVVLEVIRILYRIDKENLIKLIEPGYYPWKETSEGNWLALDNDVKQYSKVIENIYIRNRLGRDYYIEGLLILLHDLGYSSNDLKIYFKNDESNSNIIRNYKKSNLVREALDILKNEGLIIYDPDNMPESNMCIKYKVPALEKIFENIKTSKLWDRIRITNSYMNEVLIVQNQIVTTFAKTDDIISLLKEINAYCKKTSKPHTFGEWPHFDVINTSLDTILDYPLDEQLSNVADILRESVKEHTKFASEIKSICEVYYNNR